MVAAVLIARFSLVAAVGNGEALASRPMALAPEPGGRQTIGEASGPAEAFGARAGITLSEALSRCPELILVPPDPGRAEAAWEEVLRRLEGIGAAVEPGRAGEAFFETAGLRGLWGDTAAVLGEARRAVGIPAELGAGPTRFSAYAAARSSHPEAQGESRGEEPAIDATRGAPSDPLIVPDRELRRFLAPLPLSLLHDRLTGIAATDSTSPLSMQGIASGSTTSSLEGRDVEKLVKALERLGIRTLGKLAALPRDAIADRFGPLGLLAHEYVSGVETPPRPRRAAEELVQWLDLPEAASGQQLTHALGLLIDRLLAHPARRQRTFRVLRLQARLAAGGSWRMDVTPRRASASAERLRLILEPLLGGLPAPVAALGLRALELGPPRGDQGSLAPTERDQRLEKLREAVRQARAACGRDAVLRVLEVDPASHVPERRAMLAPYSDVDPTGAPERSRP
ncbi:MAG: DNA polymerase Y family protein [Solirubrobacterales bacterium]